MAGFRRDGHIYAIVIGANYFLLLCRCEIISLLDCIINSFIVQIILHFKIACM